MYAYKEIIEKKADILRITKLLDKLLDQKIEVTIVPLSEKKQAKSISLLGALEEYKDTEKQKLENLAWEQAINKKYINNLLKYIK